MLQRHHKAGDLVAENMDTLLIIAALKYSQFPLPEVITKMIPKSDLLEDCWANSLLVYAAKGGIYLSRQGFLPCPSSTPIVNLPTDDEVLPPRAWISQRKICTQEDLYSLKAEEQASWHNFTPTEGTLINKTIITRDPPKCLLHFDLYSSGFPHLILSSHLIL